MNRLKKIGTSRIAVTVVAAVIASAGAAVAAGGGDQAGGDRPAHRGHGHPGHGPGGPAGLRADLRYMTYSETHVFKNGKETVVRTDAGKVKSVSDAEITITERDGNDVSIPVNEDTEVHSHRDAEAELSSLKAGQQVIVARESGQPADHIGVRPSR